MKSSGVLKKSSSFVFASRKVSTVKRNNTCGVYPFTKINSIGKWFARSAVWTSPSLRVLRPSAAEGASWRAGVGG